MLSSTTAEPDSSSSVLATEACLSGASQLQKFLRLLEVLMGRVVRLLDVGRKMELDPAKDSNSTIDVSSSRPFIAANGRRKGDVDQSGDSPWSGGPRRPKHRSEAWGDEGRRVSLRLDARSVRATEAWMKVRRQQHSAFDEIYPGRASLQLYAFLLAIRRVDGLSTRRALSLCTL